MSNICIFSGTSRVQTHTVCRQIHGKGVTSRQKVTVTVLLMEVDSWGRQQREYLLLAFIVQVEAFWKVQLSLRPTY